MKESQGKTFAKKKESLIGKILKSYAHGFACIFGGLAPALCLLGIFCR